MDYEPGKVPRKEEWDKQTTTKTRTYDPFASNVKLVGGDMTKKDYDDFFKGFNDPWGEKREQQKKEQERKERLAKIRASTDNRIWTSQSILSSQTDPFLEGFNGTSTEENKWTSDFLKKKQPEY